MPQLPEVIFYPILVLVLYIGLVVKVNLTQTRLRLDSRQFVYGPLWAPQEVLFR